MIGSHQWLPRVWWVGLSLTRMWHETKQTKPDCPGTCNNSQVEKSRTCFFHLGLGNDMLTTSTWHSHSSILRGLPRLMVGLEALGFSMKTARGRENRHDISMNFIDYTTKRSIQKNWVGTWLHTMNRRYRGYPPDLRIGTGRFMYW